MSTKTQRTRTSIKNRFSNFSNNKRKWTSKYSYSNPKDNNTDKIRKISFQLIDQDKVEVNPNFFMPTQIVSLLKQHKAFYNTISKAYQFPFDNYSKAYKDIDKLIHSDECKKIIEFKGISLEPIPLLPLEVSSKAKDMSKIKFKIITTKENNKKSTAQITLDFTKDKQKSIDSLPDKFLSFLYQFQKDGISFGIQRKGRFLLADEMGVGKSIQAIGVALLYKENWPVLIICPSSLKLVWRDEILKWIPDINKDKINIQVFKSSKDPFKNGEKFYIMSYDLTTKLEKKIIEKNFNFIIADEAHYLKSPDAKRTKCLIPIIQTSKRVLLLTGTPILSRPVELYPLLTMLRPDLFHNFKAFGVRYCNPKKNFYGTDWTGSSFAKELNYILKNIMIRRLKKDVMSQLPPKKRQKVEIQTDAKVIKQITAININSENLFQKLEEINSNPNSNIIYDEDESKDSSKIQGVKDYIHYLLDNKCKFLVFAHHKIMLDALEEEVIKMKIDYIRIDGKVKIEKRREYVNKFQTDETCLVAILSITACYTGITLTAASTVVFSELHMTPAVMIQAEDRAHRIGQEHECVNIHYLYGPQTLDEVLFKMLNQKQNIFANTLDNISQNMEVKYTFKKVGDFEKGKSDLDVNINNKKIIVTESGTKNRTLNDFVSYNKNNADDAIKNTNNDNDNDNEISKDLRNINIHRSQVRNHREYTPTKNSESEEEEKKEIDDEDNEINIDDFLNDSEISFKKIEKKEETEMNIDNKDDKINNPTKDKNKKDKKSGKKLIKKADKNSGKIMFRSISDYFK